MRALLTGLAALLATASVFGLFALYRMVAVALRFAERRSNFAAAVSHELKTPLTAIRMFTETLLMDRARDRQDELKCIELIDKEASRLSRLLGQLLEFSRIVGFLYCLRGLLFC